MSDPDDDAKSNKDNSLYPLSWLKTVSSLTVRLVSTVSLLMSSQLFWLWLECRPDSEDCLISDPCSFYSFWDQAAVEDHELALEWQKRQSSGASVSSPRLY